MRRALAGATALAFACGVAAAGLSYVQALALSDRDEASLRSTEYDALVAAHGTLVGNAIMACMDTSDPPAKVSLAVVMQLDAQGRVVRTWHRDDDPLTLCFERYSAGTMLPAPPRVPFYTAIELDLDVNRDG